MKTANALPSMTVPALAKAKQDNRKLAMLTAYDAAFARILDANGIDLILVGDSLGMVVQGHASTVPVTVEQMTYHTECVARHVRRALLLTDLPFQADASPQAALAAATAFLRAGAHMVKIEGGAPHKLEIIAHLVAREIPVCSHLGLTPQAILRMGKYSVQGRGSAGEIVRQQAHAAVAAGAALIVLECVPAPLAQQITQEVTVPVIGIGAGVHCDGQVLVLHDMLGLNSSDHRPKFVKDFLGEGGSITQAIQAYVAAVQTGAFPTPEHSYHRA